MSANKGTGAGGKNTNKNGLNFEKISDSIPKLLDDGFIRKELSTLKKSKNKFSFYLEKTLLHLCTFKTPIEVILLSFNVLFMKGLRFNSCKNN